MHMCCTMTIQPTSAYEGVLIYYILNVVNLLHVLVTFCDHVQVSFFFEGYHVFVIYPSKNTSLNMVTKGDRNMYEVYNV